MKVCAVGVLITILNFSVFAQVVSVYDQATGEPIADATVFLSPSERYFITDAQGQVRIVTIGEDESVTVSHSAYQSMKVPASLLANAHWTLYLADKVVQVEEVVVSANKWKQHRTIVPNQVVKVAARDIAYKNPQTSADLLASTGQVFVQKSQMGGGSPMLRGFGASSVLIMLDGIRINNAIYRSGNLQNVITIDPTMLSSTEVFYGPGSTLYGSDALGGVLSFQTLSQYYPDSESLQVKGSAFLRYASANHENTFGLNLKIGNKRFSNITSLSFSDFSDLRSGSLYPKEDPDFGKRTEYVVRIGESDVIVPNSDPQVQRFSGYRQFNVMNKMSYRLGDKSEFSYLMYYTNTSNIPRYDRLTERDENGVLKNAQWYYGPQFLLLNAFSFTSYTSNPAFDQARITLSNQMVDESRVDRRYQSDSLRSRLENVDVYALNMDLEKDISDKSTLYYGGEYLINHVTSTAEGINIVKRETYDIPSRYPGGGSQYTSGAFYTSLNHRFSEKLSLDAGLRYTYITLDETFSGAEVYELPYNTLSQENGALSGKAGLTIRPLENLRWNVLFSSGFRAPNVDDMGKVFDSGDVVVIPNEDLKPEYSFNYETGLEWKIKKRLRLSGVFYYSDLKDAMVRRDNPADTIGYDFQPYPTASLVNAGEAYIYGYSLGMDWMFTDQFALQARINDSFGRDEVDDVPLRHTHPFFGKVGMKYQTGKLKAELWSDFQGKRGLDDLAPSELDKLYLYSSEGALAWWTLNLRSAYYFNEHISITAALENILDKHYRTYSSGISAPGINGVLSARYQF